MDVEPTEAELPPVAPGPAVSRNRSGRTVLRNALSGYVSLIASALVGFVCTPLLLNALGTTRFGIYAELGALAGYLGLFEAGLGIATITRVAAAEHSGTEAVALVARTALVLFTAVGITAAAASVGLAVLVPHLFEVPGRLRSDAELGFLALGLTQSVNSCLSAWTALLIGTGRMSATNLFGAGISIATSIATVVAAELGGSLLLLGAVQFVGALVTLWTFRATALRDFPQSQLKLRGASRDVARALFRLGWPNAISSVMGTLAFGSDLVLIGLLLTPRAAAQYAIALRGYAFLQNFVNTAVGAFGPAQAHRAAVNDMQSAFELFAASVLITLGLAVLCALPVVFFAHSLLHLWLGSRSNGSVAIVQIFCAVLLLQTAGKASAELLVNSEHPRELMVITTLSAAVNVVASVFLTSSVGVTGPALGTLIAVGLVEIGLLPYRACHILGTSVLELVRRSVVPLVAPTAAFAALLALAYLFGVSGLLVLPVAVFAIGIDATMLSLTPAVRHLRTQLTK